MRLTSISDRSNQAMALTTARRSSVRGGACRSLPSPASSAVAKRVVSVLAEGQTALAGSFALEVESDRPQLVAQCGEAREERLY